MMYELKAYELLIRVAYKCENAFHFFSTRISLFCNGQVSVAIRNCRLTIQKKTEKELEM